MGIAEKLRETDLFSEVDLVDLEALVERMKQQAFEVGEVLFNIGDPGDSMYIITAGRIRIYMYDREGEEITLAEYSENEIFGELSPIDQRPRSASAAAAEPLEVLILNREDFLTFLNERPQIGLAMMRSLSQRLRNTTTTLEEYRPDRFEKAEVPRGEEFRQPAAPSVADLIDKMDEKPDEKVAVPSPVEMPQKPTGMGIFDRIAAASAEDQDDEEKQQGEDN